MALPRVSTAHNDEVKAWLAGVPDLPALFGRLDVNGDGLVSRDELQALVAYGALSAAACSAVVYMADADGDGQISLAEFERLGELLRGNDQLKTELGVGQPPPSQV